MCQLTDRLLKQAKYEDRHPKSKQEKGLESFPFHETRKILENDLSSKEFQARTKKARDEKESSLVFT